MSVTVSIPTILRTHTGGEKRVSASGDTLSAVIADLEANYSGISERLVDPADPGKLQRFVNEAHSELLKTQQMISSTAKQTLRSHVGTNN